MHNDMTQAWLSSDSRSHWKPKVIIRNSELVMIGEVAIGAAEQGVPTLESLERRHNTSSQQWVKDWLADDVDPRQPL